MEELVISQTRTKGHADTEGERLASRGGADAVVDLFHRPDGC